MKQLGFQPELETVWCVWNHARSFGNSILIIFLFLKISIGRLVPELVFRGWKSGLDGLETVWGVWNQARSFGNSILNIFLFWKISIRRLVPELFSAGKKTPHEGGGEGGPIIYCKSEPNEKVRAKNSLSQCVRDKTEVVLINLTHWHLIAERWSSAGAWR